MKITSLLTGICAAALLAGCATPAPQQTLHFPNQHRRIENAANARIYILRPSKACPDAKLEVEADKALIGRTAPRSYLCWEHAAGATQIVSRGENADTLNLQLEPGHVYYIVQEAYPGIRDARTHLVEVSERQGAEFLHQCRPPAVLAPHSGY